MVGPSTGEASAMRRALSLAADPTIRPGANPRVGCVLLDADGRHLAEGVHRGAGTRHAEADALADLAPADSPRLHTAVVTLEPCNHHGRTPPCSATLVEAGIKRVVFAVADPNPTAAGGAAYLRDHGVEVQGDVLRAEAEQLDPFWLAANRLGRPHVTWKFAATLDGRSAAADGSSQWITSEQARADVHLQRLAADAVLVGIGTVLSDNPRLSVREYDGTPLPRSVQPARVVLGARQVPADFAVMDDTAETALLASHDPAVVLAELWDNGVRRAFLEGGPTVAAAFWRAGLIDRVIAYLAPALLGAGVPAVQDLGIGSMADIARLDLVGVERVGPDVRLELVPNHPHPARQGD